MIKLNRTTEYGLIALRHMNRKRQMDPRGVTSAREIADHYGLPFEITAKTLQHLKNCGLIESEQGARGGYTLRHALENISLADFLQWMEGPQALVACTMGAFPVEQHPRPTVGGCECEYHSRCEIRGLMSDLNSRVLQFLSGIRLAEFAGSYQSSGGLGTLPVSPSPAVAAVAASSAGAASGAVSGDES